MKRVALILYLLPVILSCGKSPDLLWQYKTGGAIYSSPAVAGPNLVIASTDGLLYALNLKSGALAWKQQIGAQSIGTPLARGDSIYVGGGKGDMFCLESATGKVRWQFHTGSSTDYKPCADETGIYFGNRDYSFYKLDYQGNKIWDYRTGYYLWGTCSFYKDLVVTGAWDFNVYAFERATGNVRWKHSAGKQIYGSPEVVNDEVLFATHTKMTRLDAATGKVLGQVATAYLDEITVWNGFLWTADGGLNKRAMDGTLISSVAFKTTPQVKPVSTGKYFVLAGGNILYGVSPELKILWKLKVDDDFWRTGVVAGDAYYIGNRNFCVYAVRLS